MKTISKLFTTCTLLISGALVSFAADATSQQGPNPMPQQTKPAGNKEAKAQQATAQNATKTAAPELKQADYTLIIAAVDPESALREIKSRADKKLSEKEKIKSFLETAYKKSSADIQNKIKTLKEAIDNKLSKQTDDNISPETKKEVWDIILILHKNQQPTPQTPAKQKPMDKKQQTPATPNPKPASKPVNTPAY